MASTSGNSTKVNQKEAAATKQLLLNDVLEEALNSNPKETPPTIANRSEMMLHLVINRRVKGSNRS